MGTKPLGQGDRNRVPKPQGDILPRHAPVPQKGLGRSFCPFAAPMGCSQQGAARRRKDAAGWVAPRWHHAMGRGVALINILSH